jgi:hypothetical protein
VAEKSLRLKAEAIAVDQALLTLDVRFNRQGLNSRSCVRVQELTQLRLSHRITRAHAVVDADLPHDAHWPPPIAAARADDKAHSTVSWEHREMNGEREKYPSLFGK